MADKTDKPSKPGKTEETTTLGTFRIDKLKWEAFRNKSGNASKVLLNFIDSYLAGEQTPVAAESRSVPSNLDDRLDKLESRINYLENLEKRLESLEGNLGELAA